MSITLCYACKMQAGQGPAYWWPLLCEVLRDHDFRFGDPTLPGKVSDYFYNRYLPPYDGEKEEHESSIGSLRTLWDEIYRQVGGSLQSWAENPLMMGWDFLSLFEQDKDGIGVDSISEHERKEI